MGLQSLAEHLNKAIFCLFLSLSELSELVFVLIITLLDTLSPFLLFTLQLQLLLQLLPLFLQLPLLLLFPPLFLLCSGLLFSYACLQFLERLEHAIGRFLQMLGEIRLFDRAMDEFVEKVHDTRIFDELLRLLNLSRHIR